MDLTRPQAIFGLFWGLYGLNQSLLLPGFWIVSPATDGTTLLAWGLVLSSLALIARPQVEGLLALQCGIWAILGFDRHPHTNNHAVLTTLIGASVAVCFLWAAWRRRRGRSEASFYQSFAPLVRWQLLILYFWVGFHKLNRDFFDPSVSCAWEMYVDVASWLPILPTWDALRWPVILGVIATELALPLLLVLPRLRPFGIALGTVFHMSLALHTNIFVGDFTLMMMACYALFLPEGYGESLAASPAGARLRRLWRDLGRAGHAAVWAAPALAYLGLWLWTGDGVRVGGREVGFYQVGNRALFVGVAGLWIAALLLGAGSWRGSGVPRAGALLRVPLQPAVIFPATALVWGLQPYLGLGTSPVFSMFSNLRVEEHSNHLLMPRALQIDGVLDDIVEVCEVSDPRVLEERAEGPRYPFVWWQWQLSRHPDPTLRVKIIRGGVTQEISRSEEPLHEIFRPAPAWVEWTNFRPVPARDEPAQCLH